MKEAEHHKAESRRLRRERNDAISDLKFKHKAAFRLESQLSAAKIKKKDNQLKEVSEEAMRVRASWAKTIDEMKGLRSKRNNAKKKMAKLRALSHKKTQKLKNIQIKYRALQGEITTEQMTAADLEEKVGEYEAIIDWMETQYNEKESEYKTVMEHMNHYYEEEVETMNPRYLRKHYVPNASGKGMPTICFPCLNFLFQY